MDKSWMATRGLLISSFGTWVKNAPFASILLITRSMGGTLPLPVLWYLLWPCAFLRAAWELAHGGPRLKEFRAKSCLLGGHARARCTLLRLLVARSQLNLSKIVYLW